MKILHVLSTPSAGGAEVYVRDLSLALKRRGHEVTLGFVGHAVDVGRTAEFEEAFLDSLQKSGIQYFFIGNECRRQFWKGISRVNKFVQDNGIEIYHTHLMYGIVFGARLPTPCIYTHHNIIPKSGKLSYFFYNRIVDEYVGISRVCSVRLREYTRRPVTTILNGADVSKFRSKMVVKHDVDRPVQCIALGGFYDQKNYPLMIEAISQLSDDTKQNMRLWICGEGPSENKVKIENLIRAKNLSEQIELLGNRSDVPDLLAESDVFLMSSAWEGLPIALIEASIAGLSCVVTDVGGCSEVIETCENGIVVPKDDASLFGAAIANIVNDSSLRKRFKENALERSDVFSIDNSCEEHVKLYNNVLSKSQTARRK